MEEKSFMTWVAASERPGGRPTPARNTVVVFAAQCAGHVAEPVVAAFSPTDLELDGAKRDINLVVDGDESGQLMWAAAPIAVHAHWPRVLPGYRIYLWDCRGHIRLKTHS